MKKTMLVWFIGAVLLASPNLLHAQSSAPADSVVQVTAEAQGLELAAPEDLANGGTFWLVTTNGITAPSPCPPGNLSDFPVYAMADGIFLVDETGGQATTNDENSTVESALAAQADAVTGLINQIQEAQDAQSDGGLTMGAGRGAGMAMMMGSFSSMMTPTYDTNGLWLEMTNLANGWSYFNLHNGTNFVYAILSTTSLAGGTWNVETELFPTLDQTNVLPFALQNSGRQTLLVKAMDWTGVTENGNTAPDWWLWEYYGTTALADTNLDANGNTLLYDYTNSYVPAVFNFTSLEVPNNYVSTTTPSVQLNVTGFPYYVATLVDDGSFSNAVWNSYSSSGVTVNLGATEGWHDVWIGLRGHADDASAAIWKYKRLKLDITPPVLIITSPTNGTVDVPMIQLQGFSTEALESISYDLTNALGSVTNQQVLITDQSYSTSAWEFSTNYFQGYDVPLTNGVNQFTLHATDLAGNVTTLVTNFTLDYSGKTNPPAVTLLWPLDGMEICGSDMVCRGSVSDPTASVTVQLVDANGNTNMANSLVGRDGLFYADNLTLATGTNHLSYTVTDAAGNIATTNITVMTSDLGLTLDPVVAGQALVTGTIDDDSYTVYVNDVAATNDGYGNWSATIPPISGTGGAVVVNAVNGGDPTLQQKVPSPQGVYLDASHYKQTEDYFGNDYWGNEVSKYQNSDSAWSDKAGGSATGESFNGANTLDSSIAWPASPWPEGLPLGTLWLTNNGQFYATTHRTAGISFHYGHSAVAARDTETGSAFTEMADGALKFATGGPLGSTIQRLWQFSGSVTVHHNPTPDLDEVPWSTWPDDETVADGRVSLGTLGNLDANGNVYVLLADNTRPVVTPQVGGADSYSYPQPTPTAYTPTITANNIALSNDVVVAGADLCVGQGITFDITGLPSRVYNLTAIWTLPGTFVNTNSDPNCDLFYEVNTNFLKPAQGTSATHCWYVLGTNNATASVHVYYRCTQNGKLFDETITGKFNVHRPTTTTATPYQPDGTPIAQIVGNSLSLGTWGPTNDMSFSHTITTDSFTSGQAGYFQLVSGTYTDRDTGSTFYVAPHGTGTPDTELDNRAPTTGPFSISENTNNIVVFQDAPQDGLDINHNAKEDLEFSNYLMFQPPGGIWVPLRLITWELHDESLNLTVQGGATITGNADSTSFPDWKNVFGNHGM